MGWLAQYIAPVGCDVYTFLHNASCFLPLTKILTNSQERHEQRRISSVNCKDRSHSYFGALAQSKVITHSRPKIYHREGFTMRKEVHAFGRKKLDVYFVLYSIENKCPFYFCFFFKCVKTIRCCIRHIYPAKLQQTFTKKFNGKQSINAF